VDRDILHLEHLGFTHGGMRILIRALTMQNAHMCTPLLNDRALSFGLASVQLIITSKSIVLAGQCYAL